MSRAGVARLAWALWGLFAATTVLVVAFLALNDFSGVTTAEIGVVPALAAFATTGAIIASRRPENSIGWLFLAIGVITILANLGVEYARYSLLTEPGALPGATGAVWMSHWTFGLGVELIIFLLLLFPDGKPVSNRWKPVLWLAGAVLVAFALDSALRPGNLTDSETPVTNPLGISGSQDFFEGLNVAANVGLQVVAVLSVASLLARARRSRGQEREQLKLFAYAAALMVVASFVGNPLAELLPEEVAEEVRDLPFVLGIALLPIATGVAILRYRLYDIDRIVNRTLVYGALTALLAAAYITIVVALQSVIPGAEGSDLTIAGSTLAVAALFRPLLARVQGFIDRRFYRRKYDMQRTLESFSSRLREDVDLDHLSADLLRVVHNTMQPAHASLWLKEKSA
jgi:hypothetical protein